MRFAPEIRDCLRCGAPLRVSYTHQRWVKTLHVGVFRALTELGIPIDVVGGSSFGSIAAGFVAMGMPWQEQRDSLWDNLSSQGSVVDLTAPAVSLAKGHRVTRAIRAVFEGIMIEDFWLPYFCLSSNLSRGEVTVHDLGPAWQAMRASTSTAWSTSSTVL